MGMDELEAMRGIRNGVIRGSVKNSINSIDISGFIAGTKKATRTYIPGKKRSSLNSMVSELSESSSVLKRKREERKMKSLVKQAKYQRRLVKGMSRRSAKKSELEVKENVKIEVSMDPKMDGLLSSIGHVESQIDLESSSRESGHVIVKRLFSQKQIRIAIVTSVLLVLAIIFSIVITSIGSKAHAEPEFDDFSFNESSISVNPSISAIPSIYVPPSLTHDGKHVRHRSHQPAAHPSIHSIPPSSISSNESTLPQPSISPTEEKINITSLYIPLSISPSSSVLSNMNVSVQIDDRSESYFP